MQTVEFRTAALDEHTWFVHWELWQAASELGLERRETTLGYSLFVSRNDGSEFPVLQGIVSGIRLPLHRMWPHGVPEKVTDSYRENVEELIELTDAEKEPYGEFPDSFDQRDAAKLVAALEGLVNSIGTD